MSEKMSELRTACEFPTEKDLDWMEQAFQRHTQGIDGWWHDNVLTGSLTHRDVMQIIITAWEAGRGGKNLPNTTNKGAK